MKKRVPTLVSAALALGACGGGGGGPRAETIPPAPGTPTPTPAPTPAVTIFANPTVTTFASVGVATSVTGADTAHQSFGPLSSADADQVHIRYTSGGSYEIEMPGAAWDRLIIAKGAIPQDPATFNWFQPQSAPQNGAALYTEVARTKGYQYSELATWLDPSTHRLGELAFGAATPDGNVPVTGSASYHGVVSGTSDVVNFDSFDGYYRVPVNGSVDLSFDFGSRSLAGSMSLGFASSTPAGLGTFAFKDTVFPVGSTTYSGRFDTALSGQNFFLGRFTGPHAEETVGAWALPFTYSLDDQTHQAIGAWIAK